MLVCTQIPFAPKGSLLPDAGVLAVTGSQLPTSAERIAWDFQELHHLEISTGCSLLLRQPSPTDRLIDILELLMGLSWDQTSPETTCLFSFFSCFTLLFSHSNRFLLKTFHHLPGIPISFSTFRDHGIRHHLSGVVTLSFTSLPPYHVCPSYWLLHPPNYTFFNYMNNLE